jgi:hypothetical protein
MVWETCEVREEGSHNRLTYFINFHSIYILTCLDMRRPLTHPAPSCPHHHHLPCMQEQAGGERSWPAPPSIEMGYLRRVPVELKQRPRLVSVAAVIAFVVNAGIDSGGSGVGWKA